MIHGGEKHQIHGREKIGLGWLPGWLRAWLGGWLLAWLVVWVAHWPGLGCWLAGRPVGWLAGCWLGWRAGWLACWPAGWLGGGPAGLDTIGVQEEFQIQFFLPP